MDFRRQVMSYWAITIDRSPNTRYFQIVEEWNSEDQSAAWAKDPVNFTKGLDIVWDMFKNIQGNYQIKFVVAEGKGGQVLMPDPPRTASVKYSVTASVTGSAILATYQAGD